MFPRAPGPVALTGPDYQELKRNHFAKSSNGVARASSSTGHKKKRFPPQVTCGDIW